jgi:hypothetical protein
MLIFNYCLRCIQDTRLRTRNKQAGICCIKKETWGLSLGDVLHGNLVYDFRIPPEYPVDLQVETQTLNLEEW